MKLISTLILALVIFLVNCTGSSDSSGGCCTLKFGVDPADYRKIRHNNLYPGFFALLQTVAIS